VKRLHKLKAKNHRNDRIRTEMRATKLVVNNNKN
jgi:hypothetical protein